MPIYEFVCNDCGDEFEKLLSFSATSAPECPTCHGTNVKRQMGLPAIHFKGSGWYINDSKKATSSTASTASSTSEDTAEKSASTKDSTAEKGASVPSESTPDSTKSDSKKSAAESTSAVKASVSE